MNGPWTLPAGSRYNHCAGGDGAGCGATGVSCTGGDEMIGAKNDGNVSRTEDLAGAIFEESAGLLIEPGKIRLENGVVAD